MKVGDIVKYKKTKEAQARMARRPQWMRGDIKVSRVLHENGKNILGFYVQGSSIPDMTIWEPEEYFEKVTPAKASKKSKEATDEPMVTMWDSEEPAE